MPNSRKGNNSQWCRTLKNYHFDTCASKPDVYNEIGTRYTKVNAAAYGRHSTIEFRQHSGTVNYQKVINWVKFLRDLIKFSEKNVLTTEVKHIEDITFVSDDVMAYLKERKQQLA